MCKNFAIFLNSCTRWNSTLHMIARVCQVKEPLMAVMGILQIDNALSTAEWEVLQEVCSVLEPFDIATTELSAEKNVSVSKVSEFLHTEY